MNVELLLKIKDQILRKPESFDADAWIDEGGKIAGFYGWAALLSGRDLRIDLRSHGEYGQSQGDEEYFEHLHEVVRTTACAALEISDEIGKELEDRWLWPVEFFDQYVLAEEVADTPRRSWVMAKLIDKFIADNSTTTQVASDQELRGVLHAIESFIAQTGVLVITVPTGPIHDSLLDLHESMLWAQEKIESFCPAVVRGTKGEDENGE